MPKKPIFTSPQEAETAFYEALERGDLEAMMSVWSEDEEIVCVHPGGARLTGYALVREAWHHVRWRHASQGATARPVDRTWPLCRHA
jgi:ketosteroid isomerase-like protein